MLPPTKHDEWPYWRHAYLPTSFEEFPIKGKGKMLQPGAYSGDDVLYFTRIPGEDNYSRHRVTELLVGEGVIHASIMQPPYGHGERQWTSMDLAGECAYLCDSVNSNLNIKVHGVCRFVLKSTSVPRGLSAQEEKLLDRLKKRLKARTQEQGGTEQHSSVGDIVLR